MQEIAENLLKFTIEYRNKTRQISHRTNQ